MQMSTSAQFGLFSVDELVNDILATTVRDELHVCQRRACDITFSFISDTQAVPYTSNKHPQRVLACTWASSPQRLLEASVYPRSCMVLTVLRRRSSL